LRTLAVQELQQQQQQGSLLFMRTLFDTELPNLTW